MKSGDEINTLSNQFSQIVESALKKVAENYIMPQIRELIEDERDEPEFYTSKELSEDFGLSSSFLHHYRKKGLIEYVQIGRKIIYPREAVHDFLNNHTNNKQDE